MTWLHFQMPLVCCASKRARHAPGCACLWEKMASWIGSQVVASVSLFSSACTSILTSVLGVTMAMHWGSTTMVLIWSSRMAGPGMR